MTCAFSATAWALPFLVVLLDMLPRKTAVTGRSFTVRAGLVIE